MKYTTILPCVADADIISCSCGYFLSSFTFVKPLHSEPSHTPQVTTHHHTSPYTQSTVLASDSQSIALEQGSSLWMKHGSDPVNPLICIRNIIRAHTNFASVIFEDQQHNQTKRLPGKWPTRFTKSYFKRALMTISSRDHRTLIPNDSIDCHVEKWMYHRVPQHTVCGLLNITVVKPNSLQIHIFLHLPNTATHNNTNVQAEFLNSTISKNFYYKLDSMRWFSQRHTTVCAVHCVQLLHTTAQNRPDNFPSCPPDNHHCSDDVYLRERGAADK